MSKPDDALLAKLNQLSPAQREALLKKLQTQKAQSPSVSIAPAMIAVPRNQPDYPLSFAQQRLWFLEQLSDSHASYNIAAAFRLEGALNIALLKNTFNVVIQRHESLRTVFLSTADGARQRVLEITDIELPLLDISNDVSQLDRRIHAEANFRFNLESGPLFKAGLFKLADNIHVLTVVLHHIISDAWSSQILLAEVSQVYSQLAQGKTPQLPDNTVQYIDYTLWQLDFLQKPSAAQQLQYWQDALSDVNNLDLPTDNTRPAITTYNGSFIRFNLNAQLTQTLKQWCKQQGCTLFSALLAAYEIFLYRYTQQTDFCIGIPIANRHHSESETIMGFFVNSLALRCDITKGDSFTSTARKVQQRVLTAQSHQDIPFEKLVLSLPGIQRNPGINPVFQTFFTLTQDNLEQGLKLPGIKADYIPADIEGTKFDISLNLREQGDGINCHFEYNRDLFATATITAMAQHFLALLEQLCLLPDLAIEKITFLTDAEYALQMDCTPVATSGTPHTAPGWNATAFHYPSTNALHELVQEQAEKTPDAVAVVDGHITLSYNELNQQANQLAHYLISLGISRNTPVAVCLERSVEMSIVLLAILKAGGCYVPLATDIPIERLRFICSDTAAKVLISTQPVDLANINHVKQLLMGNKTPWQGCAIDNPPLINQGEDIFNIIYTSGSTGNPKGVMVPHQGIINRLRWMQEEYALDTNDRIAQKTPYNFDVSVWELFWPLITGSSLYYAKPEGHKDPEYLRDFIKQYHISILHFVPSMLGLFLQTPDIDSCHSIGKVFTSGEALQHQHNEAFFVKLPKAELHNLYGPTEASIDVSFYKCHPNDSHKSIPIGKPIHNTQLHILDQQLQPLPLGAAGELYIGGIGLASGYWNQPELTQKAFIDNPWFAKGHPSKKLYKTGDVARYLPNGDIEYLGRNDHQVKIRGFRIELGEIETQLRKINGVSEAIVINRDVNGSSQLIAYIVSQQPLLDNAAYASLLKQHLPEYMLPTAYCAIDQVPLSANGKIDRKQLPDIHLADLQQHEYIPPRNAIEKTLAEMWQHLLGIEKAGVLDNFFELGGHSLLAAQMLTRIRDTFHIDLPLRTLFEVNTIEGLAKIISAMSFAADVANDSLDDDDFEEGIL